MLKAAAKFFIIALVFFILAALQANFFSYFPVFGAFPNILFAFFFTLIFFEPRNEYAAGIFSAAVAGFLMDISLPSYFGISLAALLVAYGLRKTSVNFFKEVEGNYVIFHFLALFAVTFAAYQVTMWGLSYVFPFSWWLNGQTVVSLLYTAIFATLGFYGYKQVLGNSSQTNQLKLF